jgi:zinc-ribbon domain
MHFCTNCHRAVLDEVPYCPTCGAAQGSAAAASVTPSPSTDSSPKAVQGAVAPPPLPTSLANPPMTTEGATQFAYRRQSAKSPGVSAVLNFFLPGCGYIYNGVGNDSKQIVFGILCFLGLFLGIFVPTVIEILFIGTTSSSGSGIAFATADYLSSFVLVLPFALAYDGYQRARKINEMASAQQSFAG